MCAALFALTPPNILRRPHRDVPDLPCVPRLDSGECQRTPKGEPASQTARRNNGKPVGSGSPTRDLPEGYTIRIPPEIRPL
jgi:hypothetical protein